MAKRLDANLFQILVSQVGQHIEVDIIIGKGLSISA
jgi:ethanolamine ammonia-lyase small subunit